MASRGADAEAEGGMKLIMVTTVLLIAVFALASLFFGCAGSGERWRCRVADGSVASCRTVQEP